VGTPFYCYSTQQLRQNYNDFAAPFAGMKSTIHYANKANANQAVIRTLADCGAGADITSAGELERALRAGVPSEKIVYSGVGKTRDEITAALSARVHQINVESIPELDMISQMATALKQTAPVTLRINPDVDARTHKHLATGHKETKFGIDIAQIDEAIRLASTLPGLAFKGLTVHVGTMVTDYEPFRMAFQVLADLVRRLRAGGVKIERLDLGGGVGIPYDGKKLAPFSDYIAIVREIIAPLDCELSFEPGRRLVGDAGVLVTRVTRVKQTPAKKFLVLDAGMNDLVRPAMYGARHGVVPVDERPGDSNSLSTLVGPVCETGDMFGENYRLPDMAAGDLLAILQAGAYGSAMASTYNGRPLVPEVLVNGAEYAIVRRRIAVAEQISWESLPSWMEKSGAVRKIG
jgi:diaminopimelate decarboxylase